MGGCFADATSISSRSCRKPLRSESFRRFRERLQHYGCRSRSVMSDRPRFTLSLRVRDVIPHIVSQTSLSLTYVCECVSAHINELISLVVVAVYVYSREWMHACVCVCVFCHATAYASFYLHRSSRDSVVLLAVTSASVRHAWTIQKWSGPLQPLVSSIH